MHYNLIVAYDLNYGIGHSGRIPWSLPGDLKRFRELTLHKCVIMGRKTWDSLPSKYRPLPDRINIVMSRQDQLLQYQEGNGHNVFWCQTWEELDDLMRELERDVHIKLSEAFFMGGSQIYAEAIKRYDIHQYYLTQAMT